MPPLLQQDPSTRPAPTSATQTRTNNNSSTPNDGLKLRLRGQHIPQEQNQRRIRWAEDVVDNEGMGKKSSKVCCIYHKPRPAGESSSESESSSSSSDSDSDSGTNDDGSARSTRKPAARRNRHRHSHDHDHGDECDSDRPEVSSKATRKKRREGGANAYEKVSKGKSQTTTVVQKS